MNLAALLQPAAVSVSLTAGDKVSAIHELIDLLLAAHPLQDREAFTRAVFTREELISTGIGNGIAIPHARVDGISSMMISLGIKREGMDFQALDDMPVNIFFMVIAPQSQDATEQHLKIMARISRILKSSDFCAKILACSTSEEVIEQIALEEGRFS